MGLEALEMVWITTYMWYAHTGSAYEHADIQPWYHIHYQLVNPGYSEEKISLTVARTSAHRNETSSELRGTGLMPHRPQQQQ